MFTDNNSLSLTGDGTCMERETLGIARIRCAMGADIREQPLGLDGSKGTDHPLR